jgi:hypothetical protein
MLVKSIIQKKKTRKKRNTTKNTRYRNNKKFSFLLKVPAVFLRNLIRILAYKWEF